MLDISLGSEPNGIEVCRRLREWTKTPIIVLSVHGEDKTKVEALQTGADDYLTKPFSMAELEARIQAVFRRVAVEPTTNPQAEIRVGDLYINLAQPRRQSCRRRGSPYPHRIQPAPFAGNTSR